MNIQEKLIKQEGASQLIFNQNNISGLFWNLRSIKANDGEKFDYIKTMIDEHKHIQILCLCETWLGEDEEKFFKIRGYQDSHVIRTNQRGGGVSVYVKDGIKILNCTKINKEVQIIVTKLKIKKVILNVIVVYNPRKDLIYNLLTELETILDDVGNTNTIIIGDFNVNLVEQERESEEYECFLANKGYMTRNTLITRPASNALLDHLSTNMVTGHMSIFTLENAHSDHNMLIWALARESEIEEVRMREMRRINFEVIQQEIEENMDEIMNQGNAHSLSNKFHDCVNQALEKASKIKSTETKWKKLNPWSTKELANLSLEKQNLYKKKMRYPNNQIIDAEYRRINNKMNDLRRKLKKEYCENEIKKAIDKKKSIWEVIKEVAGIEVSHGQVITEVRKDNIIYQDKEEIANILNEFYINVGPDLSAAMEKQKESTFTHLQIMKAMRLEPVTEEEILKQIDRLSNKNSSPNGISNMFLKRLKTTLTPIVTKLINKSFEEGTFPEKSKITQVIPIFKQGDHMDPGNYRPISILSGISRIQEGTMKVRLDKHLEEIKFHHNAQYGFRSDRDIQCAIFDLTAKIQTAIDRNNYASVVFIDLKKAFDTVDHSILLFKMGKIGIEGPTLSWFKSYLEGRPQQVKINNVISTVMEILCGVPQGSVLGPLLFLVYINDIFELRLNGKVQLYADDAAIFYEEHDQRKLYYAMTEDLHTLRNWFINNKLSLNLKKTNYIIFKRPLWTVPQFTIEIDGQEVSRVDSVKYLGIILDEHLTWNEHMKKIAPQLKAAAGLIYRLRKTLDQDKLKLLYYAYFHSHMCYLSSFWGISNTKLMKKVSVLQNGVLKTILGVNRRFPTKLLFSKIDVLPLEVLIKSNLVTIIYNHLTNKKPLNTEMVLNNQIHSYGTRIASNFMIPTISTTHYGTKSVHYNAVSLFNKLPDAIKVSPSVTIFKKRSKAYYLQVFFSNSYNSN